MRATPKKRSVKKTFCSCDEEIAKKAREKLLQSVSNVAAVQNNGQKVIPLDELPDHLSKGWKCDHVIESRQQVIVSWNGNGNHT